MWERWPPALAGITPRHFLNPPTWKTRASAFIVCTNARRRWTAHTSLDPADTPTAGPPTPAPRGGSGPPQRLCGILPHAGRVIGLHRSSASGEAFQKASHRFPEFHGRSARLSTGHFILPQRQGFGESKGELNRCGELRLAIVGNKPGVRFQAGASDGSARPVQADNRLGC